MEAAAKVAVGIVTGVRGVPDGVKWAWIDPTTFDLSGPTSVVFVYAAAFTMTDGFGNS